MVEFLFFVNLPCRLSNVRDLWSVQLVFPEQFTKSADLREIINYQPGSDTPD